MHENLVRIKSIAGLLSQLEERFVFVGGATVSLYATGPVEAATIRPTLDIDVVVELAGYNGYALLDESLRSIGFTNDSASGVICRYSIQGLMVDVMPTDPAVIGFSNRWYPEGFRNAITISIDGTPIQVFSLPYFLAAKWEAFKGRGQNELRTSTDFEDMVYVWEHCENFAEQLRNGPVEVLQYFTDEFSGIIDDPIFEEALYGHMETSRWGASPQKIIIPLKEILGLLRNY